MRCACANGGQSKMLGVFLCQSLSHCLGLSPSWKLAIAARLAGPFSVPPVLELDACTAKSCLVWIFCGC